MGKLGNILYIVLGTILKIQRQGQYGWFLVASRAIQAEGAAWLCEHKFYPIRNEPNRQQPLLTQANSNGGLQG